MYHQVPIEKLSHNQILKLVKGERIRVKHHPSGHKIHLSHEQHKKVMAAHRKGQGITIQADPYQRDLIKSSGILGNIGKTISSIAHSPITREIVHHAAPIVMDLGKKYLERKLSGHGEGMHHHGHHHLHHEHHAHHGHHGEGSTHEMKGEGVKRKRKGKGTTPKHRHTPKSHHGGALFGGDGGSLNAAGYGIGGRKGKSGRRTGHGISGKDVLNGFLKYGVPALQTGAMFL